MATYLPAWVVDMLADDGWSVQEVLQLLMDAPAKREPMELNTNLLDFTYDPVEDTFTVQISYSGVDEIDARRTLRSADFLSDLSKYAGGAQ